MILVVQQVMLKQEVPIQIVISLCPQDTIEIKEMLEFVQLIVIQNIFLIELDGVNGRACGKIIFLYTYKIIFKNCIKLLLVQMVMFK